MRAKEAVVVCPERGVYISKKGYGRHWRSHHARQPAQTLAIRLTIVTQAQPYVPPSAIQPYRESDQGIKYSIEASSSINTGVETTRSHLAD